MILDLKNTGVKWFRLVKLVRMFVCDAINAERKNEQVATQIVSRIETRFNLSVEHGTAIPHKPG
jgi:hypothetical protein